MYAYESASTKRQACAYVDLIIIKGEKGPPPFAKKKKYKKKKILPKSHARALHSDHVEQVTHQISDGSEAGIHELQLHEGWHRVADFVARLVVPRVDGDRQARHSGELAVLVEGSGRQPAQAP